MDHVVISPFGVEWFFWNILTLFFTLLLVLVPRNKSEKFKPLTTRRWTMCLRQTNRAREIFQETLLATYD